MIANLKFFFNVIKCKDFIAFLEKRPLTIVKRRYEKYEVL